MGSKDDRAVDGDVDHVTGVRIVKSADRTVALLEYLSAAPAPRSLREVAEDLAMPRASAYALLMTLQRRGWVEAAGSRFRLGIRSLRAAAAMIDLDDTVQATAGIRHELNVELQETVHLARLDGSEIVYLQTLPSPHSLSVVSRPGRRLAAWATALGKALLAERPWGEVAEMLPPRLEASTGHTITSKRELREELELTRARGYAVDNEEVTIGLRCWAFAVRQEHPPIYAISCSIPTARLDGEREREIVKAMMSAADSLGYSSSMNVRPQP